MDQPVLVINNVCYIDKFILKILSPKNLGNVITLDSIFKNRCLNFTIKKLNNAIIKKQYKLCNSNGKLAINKTIGIKEGKLDLNWNDGDISINIIYKFEIIDDINEAYDCSQFFKDIKSIIEKYHTLNNLDKYQKKLNHFLVPHFSGIRRELYRIDNPISVSYKIIKNKWIRFHGISDKKILEYAWDKQISGDDISIPVVIHGNKIEMY
ncbi:MAG: hypothetical protein ACTSR3_16650, partial [Candidatus Helarchaeota archaeon]